MIVQSCFQLHIELQVYQDLALKSNIGIVLLLPELQERQAQCFHLCSLAFELDAFLVAEHASGQEGSKSGRGPMLPVEFFQESVEYFHVLCFISWSKNKCPQPQNAAKGNKIGSKIFGMKPITTYVASSKAMDFE